MKNIRTISKLELIKSEILELEKQNKCNYDILLSLDKLDKKSSTYRIIKEITERELETISCNIDKLREEYGKLAKEINAIV